MIKKKKKLLNKIGGKKHIIRWAAIFVSLCVILFAFSSSPKLEIQKQFAQTAPAGVYGVYGNYDGTEINPNDGLANGWTAQISYGAASSNYNLINNSPTFAGPHSIAYAVTSSSFEELDLIAPKLIDISSYTYLTFYAEAGSPGQKMSVLLLDTNGKPLSATALSMGDYGGWPVTGSWHVYNMPISAFNASSTSIGGIAFKDMNGGTQNIQPPPFIYFDEINFSTQRGENIPQPSGGAANNGPTPTPTSIMPYYPSISPWIFIVPGIIIALAVIFQ